MIFNATLRLMVAFDSATTLSRHSLGPRTIATYRFTITLYVNSRYMCTAVICVQPTGVTAAHGVTARSYQGSYHETPMEPPLRIVSFRFSFVVTRRPGPP